jgi:hypothetical protein
MRNQKIIHDSVFAGLLLRPGPQSSSCESVQESRRGWTVTMIVAWVCLSFGSPLFRTNCRSPVLVRDDGPATAEEKEHSGFILFSTPAHFLPGCARGVENWRSAHDVLALVVSANGIGSPPIMCTTCRPMDGWMANVPTYVVMVADR